MKELIIAFGLFLFIEGILYAIFQQNENYVKKIELISTSQLRVGGLIFAIMGFIIIYLTKKLNMRNLKVIFLIFVFSFGFAPKDQFSKYTRFFCGFS